MERQETERRERKEKLLTHWDEYRQLKLLLIKDYVKTLKKQKRVREYALHAVMVVILRRYQ